MHISYRECHISTWINMENASCNTHMATVYNNGTCYGEERSYISEEKVIEKAKKFIDKLLEETE